MRIIRIPWIILAGIARFIMAQLDSVVEAIRQGILKSKKREEKEKEKKK